MLKGWCIPNRDRERNPYFSKHLKTLPKILYHHHHPRYWPLAPHWANLAAWLHIWRANALVKSIPNMRQVPWMLLKYKHKHKTSSIYDHFIIWPSSMTLTFNLPEKMFQMALLLLKENNCATLFWNPCINVGVMAQTSSINDYFIIWLSGVTLTFNLPEQMFQMALLLVKENNCANYFEILKSMHKCRIMARTSSIYDHFIIRPSSVTLTFNLREKLFQMALHLLKENNCSKSFWNPCINVWVMA